MPSVEGASRATSVTSGDGERRSTAEQLELPLGWFGRFGFAVLKPLFVAAVRASLKKFARTAEAL